MPELERCPVVSDDGRQCWRAQHDEEPYAHDFSFRSMAPPDGGTRWSDWILTVQNVRNLLLSDHDADVPVGKIDTWTENDCRIVLAHVAEAAGLAVVWDGADPRTRLPVAIREKESAPRLR